MMSLWTNGEHRLGDSTTDGLLATEGLCPESGVSLKGTPREVVQGLGTCPDIHS